MACNRQCMFCYTMGSLCSCAYVAVGTAAELLTWLCV